jgi:hypothetical protein
MQKAKWQIGFVIVAVFVIGLLLSYQPVDLTSDSNDQQLAQAGAPAQGDFYLAGPGKKVAIKSASCNCTTCSGSILKNTIEKVTNTTVACGNFKKEDLDAYDYKVFVGKGAKSWDPEVYTELLPASLDEDSFAIKVKGNELFVAGKHGNGDNWAVYDLLERFGNYWQFGPQELGDIFETYAHKDSIVIPAGTNIVEEPSWKSRFFAYGSSGPSTPSFRMRQRYVQNHSFSYIMPPATYGDPANPNYHPEYFPLIADSSDPSGYKRRIPNVKAGESAVSFQPSIANEAFQEFLFQYMVAYFAKSKSNVSISLGMNDSSYFCDWSTDQLSPTTINGQTLARSQRTAYAWAVFYNKMAGRLRDAGYGDRAITMLAYNSLRNLPPGSIKLDPMVIAFVALDSAQLFDPVVKSSFDSYTNAWSQLVHRTALHEYIFGAGFYIPRIYNRLLIPNIANRYGMGADSYYAEAYPNWGFDGTKYWLVSRMLWNTNQDYRALEQVYYKNMYGPVADKMGQLFNMLEEAWVGQDPNLGGGKHQANYRLMKGGGYNKEQTIVFDKARALQARSLLNDANNTISQLINSTSDADLKRQYQSIRNRIEYTSTSLAFPESLAVTRGLSEDMGRVAGDALQSEEVIRLFDQLLSYDTKTTFFNAKKLPFAYIDLPTNPDYTYISQMRPYPDAVTKVNHIIKTVVAEAIPATIDTLEKLLVSVRARVATIPGISTYSRSRAFFNEAIANGMFYFSKLSSEPTLDGTINQGEWDKPFFDGFFFDYYSFAKSKYRTKIHALYSDKSVDKTYIAFDMISDTSVTGSSVTGVNTDNAATPKMLSLQGGDDAVALNIFMKGTTTRILFNVGGAYSHSSNITMNVVTKKTSSGWQAELVINKKIDDISGIMVERVVRQSTNDGKGGFDVVISTLLPVFPNGNTCGNNLACGVFSHNAKSIKGTAVGTIVSESDPVVPPVIPPTPTPNPGSGGGDPLPTPEPTPTPDPDRGGWRRWR